jgi:hypothetical protein
LKGAWLTRNAAPVFFVESIKSIKISRKKAGAWVAIASTTFASINGLSSARLRAICHFDTVGNEKSRM